MRKALKYLLIVLGVILLAAGAFASFVALRGVPVYAAKPKQIKVQSTPERVLKGAHLSAMLCNDCHMDQNTGKLTGRKMDEISQFGSVISKNITKHPDYGIGKWTDGEIIYLLRTGVKPDGHFLPIMAKLHKMSDEDMFSIVSFLRSDHPWVQPDDTRPPASQYSFLAKFLTNIKAMAPMPYPDGAVAEPDTLNKVKWGEYVALNRVECYTCHSKDFTTNDYTNPPKSKGYFGGGNKFSIPELGTITSRNLTMDEETGIGSWSEETFLQALKYGKSPNGPLRPPMKPYLELSDGEIKAVFAYLNTVPKIKNKIERTTTE